MRRKQNEPQQDEYLSKYTSWPFLVNCEQFSVKKIKSTPMSCLRKTKMVPAKQGDDRCFDCLYSQELM